MAVKKKSRKKRKAAASGWKVLAAAIFLCLFLGLSLWGLLWIQQQHSPARPVPTQASTPPGPTPTAEDVRVDLESLLLRHGLSLGQIGVTREAGVSRYRVRGTFPDDELIQWLRHRFERFGKGLAVEVDRPGGRLTVSWQGQVTDLLLFVPPTATGLPAAAPRVAIIMDDLGRSLKAVRQLEDLGLAVTGSVLPETPHATETAERLHRHGLEVMVHMPMEPLNSARFSPGPNALLSGMPAAELQRRTRSYFAKVPYAVGGNNHMGSRLTEDAGAMAAVMTVLRERGVYFVDSLTTPHSVALAEARRAGLPTLARDLFLDNDQSVAAIDRQLHRLIRLARERGRAVAICHPYPATLEALRQGAATLREMGVKVVPVSALLEASGQPVASRR